MELGEGVVVISDLIKGGNYSNNESREIIEFMFRFIRTAHEHNRKIDREMIEFAYQGAVDYVKELDELMKPFNA